MFKSAKVTQAMEEENQENLGSHNRQSVSSDMDDSTTSCVLETLPPRFEEKVKVLKIFIYNAWGIRPPKRPITYVKSISSFDVGAVGRWAMFDIVRDM